MAGEVLNGVFMALTFVPLAAEFFPGKDAGATTVRIGTGMTKNGDSGASTGGTVPNIALFDNNGQRLGFQQGTGSIKDGNYADVKVHHMGSDNNKPASYISMSSSSADAICISYLAITWATGDKFQVFGDAMKLSP